MWRMILAVLIAIFNMDRAWSDTIYVTRVEPTGRPGDVDWYTDQYDLQGNRLSTLVASRDIWEWGFFRGPFDYLVDAAHDRFYIGWGHISLIDLTTREQTLSQRGGGYDSMALTPNGGFTVHEFRATFADVIHGFSILNRPFFVDWVQTGIEDGIIAVDSHDNIYVTGPLETEILVFDPAGGPRGVFAQGVATPTDMVFDRDGHLYVSESSTGIIKRFDAIGNDLGIFARGLSDPTHLAFDTSGTLYVASAGTETVERFSRDGTPLGTVLSNVLGPIALVSDLAGDATLDGVVDQFDIVKVLQAGKYLKPERAFWTEGDWNRDGRFDQRDVIASLENYSVQRAAAKAPALIGVAAVPETSPLLMLVTALVAIAHGRPWRRGRFWNARLSSHAALGYWPQRQLVAVGQSSAACRTALTSEMFARRRHLLHFGPFQSRRGHIIHVQIELSRRCVGQ